MKRGVLAVALVAALAMVGSEAKEAEAGSPYYLQAGGPRVQINVGSGYGGYRSAGYRSFVYGSTHRQLPPYGFTKRNFAVNANYYGDRYQGYSARRPPRRRGCDHGHGYGY